MISFRRGCDYHHTKCLDVGIRVQKVLFSHTDYVKLKILWVYKDFKRGNLGIVERIRVKRSEFANWKEIAL